MTKDELIFVSFIKNNDEFSASINIDGFLSSNTNLESSLKEAAIIYGDLISNMLLSIKVIYSFRKNRYPLPARKIWELGDNIFEFVNKLSILSYQIDGIYDHLGRDLEVKRKWLEKVVIFREL